MIIYQDFLEASDKGSFILDSINKFKNSPFYHNAIDSQRYYLGENTTILKRLQWFYNSNGQQQEDKFKANNRICNEFYPKIVKQCNSYLLANGLTIEDHIKKGLGRKFDNKLQEAGIKALVDGVAWGYCYINSKGQFDVEMWRGTEFIPLYDERTGAIKCGIRFWQIAHDRPLYIEFYEEDGKTDFVCDDDGFRVIKEKTSYRLELVSDVLGDNIFSIGNFSVLPVFPLYANDTHKSTLTHALKSKLDLYDIIMSDFGNNLEDSNDVYWVLKNYNGQDMGEFLADYKYYKSIKVDEDGEASAHTIDVPYQARQTALEMLKKQIFEGAMALDTSVLSGGSLTNVAIKSNMQDLDLKTDIFENQVINFVDDIVQLYLEYINKPNENYRIEFIRRTIVNDTEIVDNIYKMRSDISHETALRLNPLIEQVDEELELIEIEGMNKVTLDLPIDETEEETENEKED